MSGWLQQASWEALRDRVRRATRHRDAEDLLQTAVLRLLERDTTAIADPDAYIVRSARNLACDDARRARRMGPPTESTFSLDQLVDLSPQPDAIAIARQRLARLREGCMRLDPRTREIFLLHRLDGLRYAEIAVRLGISVSSVEKHVSKAIHALTACAGE